MRLDAPPAINGAPVMLRPFRHKDIDAWFEYPSVPSVVEHTSWNVRSRDHLAVLVDNCTSDAPDSAVRFAIADAALDH